MFLKETCMKCLGSFCNISFFWLVMPVKSEGILINPLVGCDCNAEFRPPGVTVALLGHPSIQGQLQLLPDRNGIRT